MIGQTISHYRVLDRLGEGGMGEVYVAEDTLLSRRVAIKFANVTPDEHHYQARFLREARALSALNHPHIAAVYDYGETAAGRPYIVMELIAGRDLGKLLQTDGLTIERALDIVADVADALAEAHQQGIIHRDIKPSNIMVDERGRVKVLDFGLAKLLHPSPGGAATDQAAQTLLATQTRSGVLVGTPLYLSPEQAAGVPVDGRSDLFALAAVLYECLAARPAFPGASLIEICAAVLHVEPPPPSQINPHVPPALDQIILKALAKKPAARHQTAADFSAELRAVTRNLRHSASQMRTQRVRVAANTPRLSARNTLSDTLRQPRFSPVFLILLLLALSGAWFSVRWLLRATPHTPTPEALRWYQTGETALRDGTYNTASKALENAVAADAQFALAHARLAETWTELDYSDKAKDELLTVKSLVPDPSVLPTTQALYLEAITNTVLRNFPRAIENYKQIVQQSPQTEQAYAYVDLGRAYEKNEQLDQAIESYVQATTRAPQAAAAFLHLGILRGRKQNQANAAAAFKEAENIYQALSNFEGVTEVFYQRGYLFSQLGQGAEAEAQLQKSLELAHTTNNQYQQIRALLQLSNVAYSEGNTEQAKRLATEAIDLSRNKGMENLTTQGLIDLGYAFFFRRAYHDAEQYFQQALDFAQRYKGRSNEARAELALGTLYIQQDTPQPAEGLRHIDHAQAFFQVGGYRKEVSKCLIVRGRAQLLNGEYAAAIKIFDEQLQLAKQVDDPAQVARSQGEIAVTLARQELYPAALRHYYESYEINKSLDNQLNIAYSLLNYGDMLARLGQFAEARAALDQFAVAVERLANDNNYKQLWLAWSHLIRARIALSERRWPEAQASARQALELARPPQLKPTAAGAEAALGLASALSGARADGRRWSEAAVELANQLNDPSVLAKALLARAEVRLETGAAQNALTDALKAQAEFASAGGQESEWRAWLIAGRASQQLGDGAGAHAQFARAQSIFAGLRERWGAEAFNTYLARPDIQLYRRQLDEAHVTVNAN